MKRFFIIVWTAFFASLVSAQVPDAVRTRSLEAAVRITSEADQQFGSGVVFARSGPHSYVLTAQHIVPTAKKVDVKTSSGKVFKAEVLARSSESDLAVLRLLTGAGLSATVPLAAEGAKARTVASIGWEKGDEPTCLEESLKQKVRLKKPGEKTAVACWETERKPAPGRSGGPLIDEKGLIVGVATGHDGATGYYVHSDEIRTFLRLNGLSVLVDEER
jgi:putative serine protease PepD